MKDPKIKHKTGLYLQLPEIDTEDLEYHFSYKKLKSFTLASLVKDFGEGKEAKLLTVIDKLLKDGKITQEGENYVISA